ncbi:MAG TPA: redoxin domain-containing protein, partial [Ktedonobacteraceae bacterium]|nr:redoxin domain-containing protein [Ktedonobacteraceae bacterium]
GQLHSAPVGPSTLVRNALLALVAALVAWSGHGNTNLSATHWFTTWPLAQQITLIAAIMVVVLIVGEGWLLLQSLSQQGRLLLRTERLENRLAQAGIVFGIPEQEQSIEGLPVGTKAPAFSGSGLDRETISLAALRALGKPIVLIFTNPNCAPCTTLMPDVRRWQRDYADKLTIALISRGSVVDNRAKVSEYHLLRLVIQRQDEIDQLYGVSGTPIAVLIHPDGRVDSSLAVGPENIRALVERAASLQQVPLVPLILPGKNDHKAALEPTIPKIGTSAPAFSLPDLNGESVSLDSFLGAPTLLLFWNPDCGFCKKMLPGLKAWEASSPQGAPRLLVISNGMVEQNRALGLRSPVLLNEEGDVSRLFGANGTPMAIVVDAQGKVASTLVEGAPDVLALAGSVKDAAPSLRT